MPSFYQRFRYWVYTRTHRRRNLSIAAAVGRDMAAPAPPEEVERWHEDLRRQSQRIANERREKFRVRDATLGGTR